MKPIKALLFIIVIIICLALIAFLFPSNGIIFFEKTLRFPTLTDITTYTLDYDKDPEEILKQWKTDTQTIKENSFKTVFQNENRKDTVFVLKKMEGVFELPENNQFYFDDFFVKAEAAVARHQIVRVLYYGDSQIELDRFSSNLRHFFQQKFGGGGPGMVPYHQTIPTGTINQYYSGDYSYFSLWGEVRRNKEKDYGPLSKMYRINGTNTFTAYSSNQKGEMSGNNQFSNISLLINNLNGSFNAELSDKTNQAKYTLQTDSTSIQLLNFPLNFATQSFTITMTGNANIYGVLIDNGFGIAVDNIAMRGASGLHFTQMENSLMHGIFNLLNIGLIILQYGGNAMPGLAGEKNVDAYVANIISQIRYLQHVVPNIPILFIGPSDMLSIVDGELRTYKQLPYLVEKLSLEIPKAGAAFWNMYQIMGGANSMRAWVKKGWAGNDYVHFTAKGAREIAHVLTQTFENMYNNYKYKLESP
jgi:hypothetical protein